jgi:hypothetical protein
VNDSTWKELSKYFDALERAIDKLRDRVSALEGGRAPAGGDKSVSAADIPAPIVHRALAEAFRGPWQKRTYERGQLVQHGGSAWIALEDTDGKPGEPDSGWQLFAKRGRDGTSSQGSRGTGTPR